MTEYESAVNAALKDLDAKGRVAKAFEGQSADGFQVLSTVVHDPDDHLLVVVHFDIALKAEQGWQNAYFDTRTGQLIQWRHAEFDVPSFCVANIDAAMLARNLDRLIDLSIGVMKRLSPFGEAGQPGVQPPGPVAPELSVVADNPPLVPTTEPPPPPVVEGTATEAPTAPPPAVTPAEPAAVAPVHGQGT